MKKIHWPEGKSFAFTIIDDTDNSVVDNIKPIYEFLSSLKIKSTKTVWVYPPRDVFKGQCLLDTDYLEFIKSLQSTGFEIELHNVGSGAFSREEILIGFEKFKELLGRYPKMHINHSRNPDNIYWGYKRFVAPLSWLSNMFFSKRKFEGEEENSAHFWGDVVKERIKYIRNHVFNGSNTQKYDNIMPYKVKSKKYSNYWFSSSDGHTVNEFNYFLSKKNIDDLETAGGYCIIYTHFASGFLNEDGTLNEDFKKSLTYLASRNGWFVPATQLLDHILEQRSKNKETASYFDLLRLDILWVFDRIRKKMKFGN